MTMYRYRYFLPLSLGNYNMDMLLEFVAQLAAEAEATTASATAAFPTLDDLDEGTTGAFKWKELGKDSVPDI